MKSKSDFWLVLHQLAGKLQIEADNDHDRVEQLAVLWFLGTSPVFPYKLRTLLILLAVGPPVLASIYFSPRLTIAFLVLLASAALSDWLARRMSAQPRPKRPDISK
jgi:hypothetical protein